ncbi:MAG TPA: hypothetical protein VG097_05820 [Gemmata sp.]|jgi:hypothetical protein|nr:hypothetical protein [Gemmata sp.]
MTIPDDVPDQLTLVDKDGTEHEGNGKELWVRGYLYGWKQCVWDYEHGKLGLATEKPEAPLIQTYIIENEGLTVGYLACWRAIRKDKNSP